MARRILLFAYDSAALLIVAALLSCGVAMPAYAYIDPSVMTYTIQAVAGVAVALSTVAGVALRRGRKTFMRILDIDENAKKEFEPDVHRVGPDGAPIMEQQPDRVEVLQAMEGAEGFASCGTEGGDLPGVPGTDGGDLPGVPGNAEGGAMPSASESTEEPSTPRRKRKRAASPNRKSYKPNWKERLAYGVVAAFFFAFTIFFVAPLEVIGGSSGSLMYAMGDVWWVLIAPVLGMVAFITLVLVLLRGRAFGIALAMVFAVGLCAYVQALVLNIGLPAADGNTIVWSDYMDMQIISSAVWIAIIAIVLAFCLINMRRTQGAVVVVSAFLVIVQAVGLGSLFISPSSSGATTASNAKVVMTEDQMYTVNPNHNVIVFILDTYDTAYLSRVLEKNPNLLDDLTGFTNYENATSAMIPTRFAIPEMLTGQMPSFDEKFSTYKAQRYARSSFLDQIYDADYSIGLYTDSLTISKLSAEERAGITGKTVNMHALPHSMMNYQGTLYSLYQIGLYRDVPWPFKWAFWYYTDQINSSFVQYQDNAPADETVYVMDDIRYYNRLCNIGLSVNDDGHAGAFRFIHLLGSHYPFSYDEQVNDLGEDNSDVFKQSQGAIHIVSEYVNQLKKLGVYENTTIIITADHGYWTITLDPIEETSTPIMFVKPEQSAELDAEPIKVDEKPVSHLDLQATILDAMGLDYSEYSNRTEWAGYSMFRDIDPDRQRYYLTTDSEPDLTEVQFREYLIDGNALDWDNWSETGRTIDAQK